MCWGWCTEGVLAFEAGKNVGSWAESISALATEVSMTCWVFTGSAALGFHCCLGHSRMADDGWPLMFPLVLAFSCWSDFLSERSPMMFMVIMGPGGHRCLKNNCRMNTVMRRWPHLWHKSGVKSVCVCAWLNLNINSSSA